MALYDLTVAPVAETLLDCLIDALNDVPNPPAEVMMRPGGSVALYASTSRDECCEGLGWLRVANIYPSANFPDPDAVSNCGIIQLAVVFELGVARCAPTPDANNIPSKDEWDTLTADILADAAAMRRALCCFADVDTDRMILPGLWQPMPTSGGCAGGTQQVTVAILPCDCE